MSRPIPRRRFIVIAAAAAGLPLAPPARARAPAPLRIWRGTALGAKAILQLHHPDAATADRIIGRCLAEIERLERVFSLYRADSAIVRLNGAGRLDQPPLDLVRLLGTCAEISRLTAGAFDITVQPLWRLYADHFARAGADPRGPGAPAVERALRRVNHAAVEVGPVRIRFARPDMAITLNGIAQGYVTDRVIDILRESGLEHALVDLGEIRALGSAPDGAPWHIGIEDPAVSARVAERIDLANKAIATSGGYGFRFDAAGRFNHLFDPRSGACSGRYLTVSVIAPTATIADGLSTACTLIPIAQAREILGAMGVSARFFLRDGSRVVHES